MTALFFHAECVKSKVITLQVAKERGRNVASALDGGKWLPLLPGSFILIGKRARKALKRLCGPYTVTMHVSTYS